MPYSTQADLAARFGVGELIQLTDHNGTGSIDLAVLGQAIADADAIIDGHLAGRYTLPLDPVPAILTGYACDLVRARLYKDAAPEIVIKRADDAMRFLSLIGQGRLTLGVQPEPAGSDTVQFTPARPRDRFGL